MRARPYAILDNVNLGPLNGLSRAVRGVYGSQFATHFGW